MNKAPPLVASLIAIMLSALGCQPSTNAVGSLQPKLARVNVLSATQSTMQRTVTQPATVHAYHEAQIFAKAAGYLTQLNVDIGSQVKAGDVLALIGVPEMAKQHESQLAAVRQMEAEERRAAAELAVANANIVSHQAKLEKTKAEVGEAVAALTAAQVELARATDLVERRAVDKRVQDEAQKKSDAAAAGKSAAEAAVNSATAELALVKAKGDAAQAEVEVAKAASDVARRNAEVTEELIKYSKLTAPFDGVVTQRNVDPGDLVRNSQTGSEQKPLLVVAQLDKVRIRVHIPERDAPLASVGDEAKITLQGLPGEELPGKITRVAGALDERTRTMLIEIDLLNPEGRLQPGMFGQATITLAPATGGLSLPANVVRFDEKGRSYVYVVNASNQIDVKDVQTGLDDGGQIEIVDGLQGDERIVGPMLKRLKPNQEVTVN